MKRIILILAASALGLRSAGFCRTANAASDDIAALQARADEQEAEIARLRAAAALPRNPDAAPPDGTLAMLCRGAGVELDDVRWRMQGGLDPDQAVQAALAQKEHDEAETPKAKGKKANAKDAKE